jgi:hypothetical protein
MAAELKRQLAEQVAEEAGENAIDFAKANAIRLTNKKLEAMNRILERAGFEDVDLEGEDLGGEGALGRMTAFVDQARENGHGDFEIARELGRARGQGLNVWAGIDSWSGARQAFNAEVAHTMQSLGGLASAGKGAVSAGLEAAGAIGRGDFQGAAEGFREMGNQLKTLVGLWNRGIMTDQGRAMANNLFNTLKTSASVVKLLIAPEFSAAEAVASILNSVDVLKRFPANWRAGLKILYSKDERSDVKALLAPRKQILDNFHDADSHLRPRQAIALDRDLATRHGPEGNPIPYASQTGLLVQTAGEQDKQDQNLDGQVAAADAPAVFAAMEDVEEVPLAEQPIDVSGNLVPVPFGPALDEELNTGMSAGGAPSARQGIRDSLLKDRERLIRALGETEDADTLQQIKQNLDANEKTLKSLEAKTHVPLPDYTDTDTSSEDVSARDMFSARMGPRIVVEPTLMEESDTTGTDEPGAQFGGSESKYGGLESKYAEPENRVKGPSGHPFAPPSGVSRARSERGRLRFEEREQRRQAIIRRGRLHRSHSGHARGRLITVPLFPGPPPPLPPLPPSFVGGGYRPGEAPGDGGDGGDGDGVAGEPNFGARTDREPYREDGAGLFRPELPRSTENSFPIRTGYDRETTLRRIAVPKWEPSSAHGDSNTNSLIASNKAEDGLRFSDVIKKPLPPQHWSDDPSMYTPEYQCYTSELQLNDIQGQHTPRVQNPNFLQTHYQETEMVNAVQQYDFTNVFATADIQNAVLKKRGYVDSWRKF